MNKRFQSICTACGKPIPARYLTEAGRVYIEKTCPEHGTSRILASEDEALFEKWAGYEPVNVPPRIPITNGVREYFAGEILNTECPMHCGTCENHLTTACCVLLNITNRCNQHCPYCFAEAGISGSEEASPANDFPSSDPSIKKLDSMLDRLTELGEERKFNIQLSGGEPTVREDLPEIIKLCVQKGFEYIQLNTNGRKLAESESYARTLKEAGLSTVFLQFDGVSDEVYTALRGEPLFAIKEKAIQNCGKAGLPVTLVPTVLKDINLSQTGAIIEYMLKNLSVIKGVHFQPASFFGRNPDERNESGDYDERVTMFAIMREIEKQTSGKIKAEMFAPISTGHPLCCFCGSFIREPDGSVKQVGGQAQSCDCSCAPPTPEEIIRRDRDFVKNVWEVNAPDSEEDTCCSGETQQACCPAPAEPLSLDEALGYLRANMFTISGMAFMDKTNLDSERLRRCRVQVFTEEERLVPFCGHYSL